MRNLHGISAVVHYVDLEGSAYIFITFYIYIYINCDDNIYYEKKKKKLMFFSYAKLSIDLLLATS